MTVSGAPETAPIEPSFCRALPPAVDGNTIAICGMASTVSGIVLPHAAFRLVTCCLNTSIASIKARHLPLKEPCTFLFFFSLPCLPHPVHCPLTKMLHYPTTTLFQYGAGVTDGHLNDCRLRHWDLVTVASLEIDLSTSTPNAVLLLMFEVMSPFMRGLPANQWLLSFWLLLPAMPSYLSFPLMTSGCSAALLWSFISKILWFFSQPGSQFSTQKRKLPVYPPCRTGCELHGVSPPLQPSFDPTRINLFMYPRHVYQPMVKLLHPF